MKSTLYHQAVNEHMDLDTRYKLARRLLTISKYERLTNMIEITEAEERTYRYYLETGKISKVMLLANRSAEAIRKQLDKMAGLGLMQRDGMGYSPTGQTYTVKPSKPQKPKAKRPAACRSTNSKKLIPPHVTEEQMEYIRGHYGDFATQ